MTWPTESAASTKTKPWHIIRTLIAVLTVGMLTFVTAACDGSGFGGFGKNANSLKVLAGSEVKDLEPILNDMEKETGVSFDSPTPEHLKAPKNWSTKARAISTSPGSRPTTTCRYLNSRNHLLAKKNQSCLRQLFWASSLKKPSN